MAHYPDHLPPGIKFVRASQVEVDPLTERVFTRPRPVREHIVDNDYEWRAVVIIRVEITPAEEFHAQCRKRSRRYGGHLKVRFVSGTRRGLSLYTEIGQ